VAPAVRRGRDRAEEARSEPDLSRFGEPVWEGRGVSGADVVRALAARTAPAAPAPGDPEGAGPGRGAMRASSLTLVVFAPDRPALERSMATVAHVAGRHPARVILVAPDPDASPEGLDARIRVEGHARAGAPIVRYEEVVLTMRRVASRHLASLVGALLVQELPVFLWHLGVLPWGRTWQSEWAETVDRLIVDSAAAPDPLEDLDSLSILVAAGPAFGMGDMAFQRLRPWRAGVADLFEAEERRALLDRVDGVEIAHPGPGGPTAGALLLAGWLRGALGWGKVRVGGADYVVCEREGGDVRIVFSTVDDDTALTRASGVSGVTVYLRVDGPQGAAVLEPRADGLAWTWETDGRDPAGSGRFAARPVEEAEALARSLDLAPDPVFEASLDGAAAMARALRHVAEAVEGGETEAWQ